MLGAMPTALGGHGSGLNMRRGRTWAWCGEGPGPSMPTQSRGHATQPPNYPTTQLPNTLAGAS